MDNKKIKVLHIGRQNWTLEVEEHFSPQLSWEFLDFEASAKEELEQLILRQKGQSFDVVLCTDALHLSLLEEVSPLIEAYGLVVDERLLSELPVELQRKKFPVGVDTRDRLKVLQGLCDDFFVGQMGSKMHTNTIVVNEKFRGKQRLRGEAELSLSGDFSALNKGPLLNWQYNIGMYERSKKLWLEYSCDEEVELFLHVLITEEGGSRVLQKRRFTQAEIKEGIVIDYEKPMGYLSIALSAQGQGELRVGPLHYRDWRHGQGEFILGGKKVVDSQQQELFYYFNPGDLQPPLNVYFSGYRSAEGFEGFFMMKKLGAPFLLITDPRLEGGSFYMGSESLERQLVAVIQESLDYLGFKSEELILSGLSMGTFGALYYGGDFSPHAIIVGKPLVHVGDIARNERIIRPGGFPTSLDILQSLTGSLSESAVATLNERFWRKFDQCTFEDTQFIVAYMKDDDYDQGAYEGLLEHLSAKPAHMISKGISGRHNDNSSSINQWFINQYRRILRESFKRKV